MTEPVIDVHLIPDDAQRSLRRDARLGLTSSPKWLQPKWFYDSRGSDLFDQITRLPEYYPTRAERSILAAHAGDIAALSNEAQYRAAAAALRQAVWDPIARQLGSSAPI